MEDAVAMTTVSDARNTLCPCDENAANSDSAEPAAAFRRADDDGPLQLTVQSLPYVKRREHVDAVRSFDPSGRRRVSLGCNAPSGSLDVSIDPAKYLTALSYSVPSTNRVSNTPRGSPAVDVIATYMNTCDQRTVKLELMRAHARFASSRGTDSFAVLPLWFPRQTKKDLRLGLWYFFMSMGRRCVVVSLSLSFFITATIAASIAAIVALIVVVLLVKKVVRRRKPALLLWLVKKAAPSGAGLPTLTPAARAGATTVPFTPCGDD